MIVEAVTLGRIVKAVGLKGEVKLLPGPDFWPEALGGETFELVSMSSGHRVVSIEKSRAKGQTYILKLSGIDDIDQAEAVVKDDLVVMLDTLDEGLLPAQPLPCQLVGLEVRLPDGTVQGRVSDLLIGAEQACLIVDNGAERFLVPNVPEFVIEIDLVGGFLVVDPPDGLFDFVW